MQDQATRKLLENYYAAFNRGDWSAFLGLLTDDVIHDINQGGREVGRETFGRFMQRMIRCYSEQIADIAIMVAPDGARAAVEFTVLGTYLKSDDGLPEATGQTYKLPGGAFFDIRGGKVARVTNYYDLQEWLRQVGAVTVSAEQGVQEAPTGVTSAPTPLRSDTVTWPRADAASASDPVNSDPVTRPAAA